VNAREGRRRRAVALYSFPSIRNRYSERPGSARGLSAHHGGRQQRYIGWCLALRVPEGIAAEPSRWRHRAPARPSFPGRIHHVVGEFISHLQEKPRRSPAGKYQLSVRRAMSPHRLRRSRGSPTEGCQLSASRAIPPPPPGPPLSPRVPTLSSRNVGQLLLPTQETLRLARGEASVVGSSSGVTLPPQEAPSLAGGEQSVVS